MTSEIPLLLPVTASQASTANHQNTNLRVLPSNNDPVTARPTQSITETSCEREKPQLKSLGRKQTKTVYKARDWPDKLYVGTTGGGEEKNGPSDSFHPPLLKYSGGDLWTAKPPGSRLYCESGQVDVAKTLLKYGDIIGCY